MENTKSFLPPVIGIRINNGQSVTNNREITVEVKSLKLDPALIAEMQLGFSPDLSDGTWSKYTAEKQNLTLPGQDGLKTVYVRLKDKAGNLSPIESGEIMLDTAPPTECSLAINNGAPFTNDRQMRVMLHLKANGAAKMQIASSQAFENAVWEAFAENKLWLLSPAGDGKKIVYARFMDAAQNISEPVEATIILDTTPPGKGVVTINGNEKYTRSSLVKVSVSAQDAEKVLLVDKNGKSETWDFEPGNASLEKEWLFDSLQGVKTIRAFFMDNAMNKTAVAVQDDIILDSEGPPPPIVAINNGAKCTNEKEGKVSLKLASKVNPALLRMQVSSSDDFKDAPVSPFAANINQWSLPAGQDGLKSVFVRLIDEAGNYSSPARADILLDRESPVIKSLKINGGADMCTSPKANITIEAEGASFMQLGVTEAAVRSSIWEPVKYDIKDYQLPVGDGEKTIYMRLKDDAENVAGPFLASIMVDTKPPSGRVFFEGSSKFSNRQDKKADVRIEYDDALEMQLSEAPDFTTVSWQPVKPLVSGWTFSGEDGQKNIFLRLKDKAGNVSAPVAATVILDRTAPEDCRVLINAGAKWLNSPSRRVTLSLFARGAFEALISNDRSFASSKWTPVKPTIGWTLEGEDGIKKVYTRFRDEAGNESDIVESAIILDTHPPALQSFTVDQGKRFTNDNDMNVVLNVKAQGADFLAFANQPFEKPESVEWRPFKEDNEWKLEGEEGPKTLFLVLKDSAGNISSPATANIILDRTPPMGCRILTGNNEKFVNHPEKKATLVVSATGASEMMISNEADFSGAVWEPIHPRKDNWTLAGDDGEKTVYARFRDEAGNVSEAVSVTIRLDRKPPSDIRIAINGDSVYATRKDRIVNVRIHALEAKSMMISQDKNFTNAQWEDFKIAREFALTGADGEKELFVKCRDEAGNESQPVRGAIILDITPPELLKLLVNNGEGWTNASDKKVRVIVEAQGADLMMIGQDATFQGCSWKAYQRENEYILPGEDGEKEIFIRLKDKAGNESSTAATKINLKRSF